VPPTDVGTYVEKLSALLTQNYAYICIAKSMKPAQSRQYGLGTVVDDEGDIDKIEGIMGE